MSRSFHGKLERPNEINNSRRQLNFKTFDKFKVLVIYNLYSFYGRHI